MKRYLTFAGQTYYPDGGWQDFAGDFDSLLEAELMLNTARADKHDEWQNIVDTANSVWYYRYRSFSEEEWRVWTYMDQDWGTKAGGDNECPWDAPPFGNLE